MRLGVTDLHPRVVDRGLNAGTVNIERRARCAYGSAQGLRTSATSHSLPPHSSTATADADPDATTIARDQADSTCTMDRGVNAGGRHVAHVVSLLFDSSGRLRQTWDASGDGYEWPLPNNERAIVVDYRDDARNAWRGAKRDVGRTR
jgi:hypothetical protein